jgi:phage tail protein X
MPRSHRNKEQQQSKKKQATKKLTSTNNQASLNPSQGPIIELMEETEAGSIQNHATLLGNPRVPPIQRQSMVQHIGQTMGNSYLRKVMLQMKQDEESRRPSPIQAPVSTKTGGAHITEKTLPNGQVEQHVSVPFSAVIARQSEGSGGAAEEKEPEPPIHIDEIPGEEEELDEGPEQEEDSTISSTIGYKTTVEPGGATPSGFGVTRSTPSWKNVKISSSFGTIFNRGTYTVTATFDYRVRYQVRATQGPQNQVDIASDSDADIKPHNYLFVAKDLTPDMGDLNGRPRRRKYWSKDITLKHEKYHATDRSTFGADGATAAKRWLNTQKSSSSSHVKDTLMEQALDEGMKVVNLRMNAPPGKEQRAYGDGAPEYTARATSIKTKGDAGDYGKISAKVKIHPKGGGTHTVGAGDTLSAIAKKVYGDANKWRDIHKANPGVARNGGNSIDPGMVFNLPEINFEKELFLMLSMGDNFTFTDTAKIPGGSAHTFLVDAKDIFAEDVNSSGTVEVDAVDTEGNIIMTVNWALPRAKTTRVDNIEITTGTTP